MSSKAEFRKSWMIVPLAALALMAAGIMFLGDAPRAVAQQEAGATGADGSAEVLARVGESAITRERVEEYITTELQRLDQERYQLLERGMEQAIENELIDLEAAQRETTREAVLEDVYDELAAPTEEAIDAFYESNKHRINQPKEEISGQIAEYLGQLERQKAYQAFLGDLRERYEIERLLEPRRTEIAAADHAPYAGKADAPVTIVEFSDFQCPYCQRLAPTLDRVVEEYGDRVQLVFRQFPLDIHADAQKAAEASLCAAEAGKFWEMHDRMFADLQALSVDQLKLAAVELELDGETFSECLDSGRYAEQVAIDMEAGRLAGVTGTPAMFINGRFLSGAQPFETIAAVIDDELQRESGR
jgi:protein-disulfide isomerase